MIFGYGLVLWVLWVCLGLGLLWLGSWICFLSWSGLLWGFGFANCYLVLLVCLVIVWSESFWLVVVMGCLVCAWLRLPSGFWLLTSLDF